MARRISPGGPFLAQLAGPSAPDAPVVLDDGDGWWVQQQNITASVVAASAAVALAVALGLPQQADELPAPPVGKQTGGESCCLVAIGEDFRVEILTYVDELIPRALDDSYWWQQADRAQDQVCAHPVFTDDALPTVTVASLSDDYWWREGRLEPAVVAVPVWVHEDFPQPAAAFAAEDAYWTQPAVQDELVLVSFPTGVSFPSVVSAALEDVYTLDPRPAQAQVYGSTVFNDDALPVSTVAAITEDYWRPEEKAQQLVVPGQTWADENFQVAALVPDESYLHRPTVATDDLLVVSFPTGGSFPSVAAAVVPDEAYWLDVRAVLPKVWGYAFVAPDDLPSALSGGGMFPSPGGQRRQYGIGFKRWEFTEELPPATPLNLDESEWAGVPAKILAPIAPLAAYDDPIVPQPASLNLHESEWASVPAKVLAPIAPIAAYDDPIVPQPAPLNLHESEWVDVGAKASVPIAPIAAYDDPIVPQPEPPPPPVTLAGPPGSGPTLRIHDETRTQAAEGARPMQDAPRRTSGSGTTRPRSGGTRRS